MGRMLRLRVASCGPATEGLNKVLVNFPTEVSDLQEQQDQLVGVERSGISGTDRD